jgi:hypothetical protein
MPQDHAVISNPEPDNMDHRTIRLTEAALIPILSTVAICRMPAMMISAELVNASTDPDPANMYMRLHYLLQALGQDVPALQMQAKALALRSTYRISNGKGIRLLAFMGPGNLIDNTPLEFVIEHSDIRLDLLFLQPDKPLPTNIPDHDIAIVAITESQKNAPLLARLEEILASWPRPVLNHPRQILCTSRVKICQRLQGIPGLHLAKTLRLSRAQLIHPVFPLTIRPVDTHCGEGFQRIDSDTGLNAYFESYPEHEYYVSEYVDYQSPDGLFRKVRIALIDSKPYICHLAISDNWVVHYMPAGMQFNAQHRAEEAAMMENFDRDFALRHAAPLKEIAARLALDYAILDCGELPDGRLLLFEADTHGWIHATDPVDIFPYKAPVMQRAFDAFSALLQNRSSFGFRISSDNTIA